VNLPIFEDTGPFTATPLASRRDNGITFQSGDEEHAVFGEVLIPTVIGVVSIKDDIRAYCEFKLSGLIDLMLVSSSKIDKCGQLAIGIKTNMQLEQQRWGRDLRRDKHEPPTGILKFR
jgi:hypothetical protein